MTPNNNQNMPSSTTDGNDDKPQEEEESRTEVMTGVSSGIGLDAKELEAVLRSSEEEFEHLDRSNSIAEDNNYPDDQDVEAPPLPLPLPPPSDKAGTNSDACAGGPDKRGASNSGNNSNSNNKKSTDPFLPVVGIAVESVPGAHPAGPDGKEGAGKEGASLNSGRGFTSSSSSSSSATGDDAAVASPEQTVLRRTTVGSGNNRPIRPGAFAHGGNQDLIYDEEQPPPPSGRGNQSDSVGRQHLLGAHQQDQAGSNNNNNLQQVDGQQTAVSNRSPSPDHHDTDQEEGLVEANPIEEETGQRPELQEAEQLHPCEAQQQRTSLQQLKKEDRKQWRLILSLTGFCILLLVAIVTAVLVGSNNSSSKNSNGQSFNGGLQQATDTTNINGGGGAPSSNNTTNIAGPFALFSTSEAPSSAPINHVLEELLMELPAYTLENLEIFGTPQYRAWEWLQNHPNITHLALWKQRELFALTTFFYSFEGPNWHSPIQDRWLDPTKDICFWFSSGFGFFKDDVYQEWSDLERTPSCTDDGHFQTLWLNNLALSGHAPSLPPELALLTNLTRIDLSWNDLHNRTLAQLLPTNFFDEMTHLKNLVLYVNGMTGTIPTEFGMLTQLSGLQLNVNSFTGTLPSQIGRMDELKTLGLWGNQVSGTIPTNIGLLSNHLQYLELGGSNAFTGTIPSQIGNLESLVYLDLSQTPTVTGTLPQELSSLMNQSLGALELSGCTGLSGTIPHEICYLADANCTYELWLGYDASCYFGFNCTEHDLLCGCDCPCSDD